LFGVRGATGSLALPDLCSGVAERGLALFQRVDGIFETAASAM